MPAANLYSYIITNESPNLGSVNLFRSAAYSTQGEEGILSTVGWGARGEALNGKHIESWYPCCLGGAPLPRNQTLGMVGIYSEALPVENRLPFIPSSELGLARFQAPGLLGTQTIVRGPLLTPGFNTSPPVTVRPPSNLPPDTGAKNLIVITHGILTSGGWIDDMATAIRNALPTSERANWQIVPYHWNYANRDDPNGGLATATLLGANEGAEIARRGYEHVHLIGHSAGAGFVDAAGKQIKLNSNATVHETFLDAYAPGKYITTFGKGADWADQYLNSPDYQLTNAHLTHAHNVNVTGLDPRILQSARQGHSWPHEFYQATISQSQPAWENYGYPLSLEGGIFEPDSYGINQMVRLPRRAPLLTIQPTVRNQTRVSTTTHLAVGATTVTGGFSLLTASPAWLNTEVDLQFPVNFINFTMEFTSEADAEGMLAVYLDDSLLGIIDETLALPGPQEYSFSFADKPAGISLLTFRLDPLTEIESNARITDIWIGLFAVPEPSSLAISALSSLLILAAFFYRRRYSTAAH